MPLRPWPPWFFSSNCTKSFHVRYECGDFRKGDCGLQSKEGRRLSLPSKTGGTLNGRGREAQPVDVGRLSLEAEESRLLRRSPGDPVHIMITQGLEVPRISDRQVIVQRSAKDLTPKTAEWNLDTDKCYDNAAVTDFNVYPLGSLKRLGILQSQLPRNGRRTCDHAVGPGDLLRRLRRFPRHRGD